MTILPTYLVNLHSKEKFQAQKEIVVAWQPSIPPMIARQLAEHLAKEEVTRVI